MADTWTEMGRKSDAKKNTYRKESARTKESEAYWDGVRTLKARVKDNSQRAEDKVYGVKRSEKGRFNDSLIGENRSPKSRRQGRGKGKRKATRR